MSAAASGARRSTGSRWSVDARTSRTRPDRSFFAFATSKHHIAAELLKHTDRSNPVFGTNRTRVIAAGQPLLAAAQAAHEVRDGLALEQILDMIIAIATIDGDTRYVEPVLQTALDGLRPRESFRDPTAQ